MAGILRDSSVFPGMDWFDMPNNNQLELALQSALRRSAQSLEELFSRSWREPDLGEVRRQTQAECEQGKFDGPWHVYKDATGQIISSVPYAKWLPTVRFPRKQQRSNSSYSVRPIDDCSRSGLNLAAAVREKMRVSGVAAVFYMHSLIASLFGDLGDEGEPVTAKGDHQTAFRQWAIFPDHMPYLVALVWCDSVGPAGGFLAYAHEALPFGALGAVGLRACCTELVLFVAETLRAAPTRVCG